MSPTLEKAYPKGVPKKSLRILTIELGNRQVITEKKKEPIVIMDVKKCLFGVGHPVRISFAKSRMSWLDGSFPT